MDDVISNPFPYSSQYNGPNWFKWRNYFSDDRENMSMFSEESSKLAFCFSLLVIDMGLIRAALTGNFLGDVPAPHGNQLHEQCGTLPVAGIRCIH